MKLPKRRIIAARDVGAVVAPSVIAYGLRSLLQMFGPLLQMPWRRIPMDSCTVSSERTNKICTFFYGLTMFGLAYLYNSVNL